MAYTPSSAGGGTLEKEMPGSRVGVEVWSAVESRARIRCTGCRFNHDGAIGPGRTLIGGRIQYGTSKIPSAVARSYRTIIINCFTGKPVPGVSGHHYVCL